MFLNKINILFYLKYYYFFIKKIFLIKNNMFLKKKIDFFKIYIFFQ